MVEPAERSEAESRPNLLAPVHKHDHPVAPGPAALEAAGMPFVYMLECEDASYYVGSTVLLEARVQQHQLGLGADYTRCRLPVKLVWFEEHENVAAAFAREKQIQNWGRAKRRALIEGRYGDLPELARGWGVRPGVGE